MTGYQKILIFLQYFGVGLLQPILTLVFLERGCTLQTIPIALAVYSATVILMEVPSGILSDLYGRKKIFYLSSGFYIACIALVFEANSLWVILPAMICMGLARASGSGSIDALIYEDAIERLGQESLSKVTSAFQVCQGLGLGLGALAGGVIPKGDRYGLALILRVAIVVVTVAMTFFLKEKYTRGEGVMRIGDQVKMSLRVIQQKKGLVYVMICISVGSLCMCAIETYWQPALKPMLAENMQWVMGLLCSIGMFGMTLGSFLLGKIFLISWKQRWGVYLTGIFAMALMCGFLGFQSHVIGFAMGYICFYVLLGAVNVPEQTLINSMTGNETRGSVISFSSLTCQLGGIGSSILFAAMIGGLGIGNVWKVAAVPALIAGGVIAVAVWKKGQDSG